MNSLVLVGYYMVKETVKPRLHHSDFEEYLEDVDLDCFRHTHNFKHMKYIHHLHKLVEEYQKGVINMWKRTSAHNPKLITASNALHAFMVFDLRKYRKNGFVRKVEKAKKDFQLPHLAN